MKTKLLTTLVVCALLISLMGCAADNTAQMLQDTADVTVNTEALTEPSADTQAVTPTAETAEKEIPAQPASTEAPLTSEMPEIYSPGESEPPKQTEPSKQTESEETPMPNDQSQSKESGKPVETQPEPAKPTEPLKETEQPKPTEPPAPPAPTEPIPTEPPAPTEPPTPVETEPPVETKPRTAYDYEFDIDAIRLDCIAIGQGMGYTLNTSLTPQNATWWNPVTASESNQGSTLKSALEQYIRFHTVSNIGAYGLDEITEFNICCESRGSGSYAIYFVLA